ncbi:Crp/Fnr family transcriptional regulator [Chryseobacterium sp.]|uniref:Crp/Fnr family transcriptional regulator n=1 Tax=Chryseobacterium sp. TaxID=1871047 RepID=UPI002896BAE2|nr:Crp/Fnr family transcriptional regulator [Chryseobacterium sp.]
MVIPENILFMYGAKLKHFKADDFIFNEGEYARYYFQIKSGIVKLNNVFEDGKEFVHGFPFEGHCFGETYLLIEKPYMVNAIAVSDCDIIKIEKESYENMIKLNPEYLLSVSRYTAERLHFRYLISSFLAIKDPEIRIYKLLKHLKEYFGYDEPFSFQVPFTRSQLASLVGLRVETVIRTLKKIESSGLLKIDHTKILY